MTPLEKIVENLMTMPESAQTEVLDFAMRGIAEEPGPYGIRDIQGEIFYFPINC